MSNKVELASQSSLKRNNATDEPVEEDHSSSSSLVDDLEDEIMIENVSQQKKAKTSVSDSLRLPNVKQPRVILWTCPRSISTAFFRAVMEGSRLKVLLEPFSNAYYYGEDRISHRYTDKAVTPDCRFTNIKEIFEEPYLRYKAVFSKDMAYYLKKDEDQNGWFEKCLPRGYTHTFLIRDPRKAVVSLYKLSVDTERTGWTGFDPLEAGFKEMYDLFVYVTNTLGQEAIVVDASDLLRNPGETLRKFCSMTGIAFSEKMLSWKSLDQIDTDSKSNDSAVEISGISHEGSDDEDDNKSKIFRGWGPWFEGVLSSNSFRSYTMSHPVSHQQNATDDVTADESLPDEVVTCIQQCMPYYKKLMKHKIEID